MSPDVVRRYLGRGVLPDANLLLLYFVGSVDRKIVPSFKRTSNFLPEDYDFLAQALACFRRVVSTPHVLTEVSNLAGSLFGKHRQRFFEELARGISVIDEQHAPAADLSSEETFFRFGITDSAVFRQARGQYLVLTEDLPLAAHLERSGIDVLNFTNLRLDNYFG